MSEVRILVGPKTYAIRCDPGEEDKVLRLGALIDEHYARLGSARTTSEANNLVFAALFMADALEETRAKSSSASGETETLAAIADQLETLAERAERIAGTLEGNASTA